MLKFSLQNSLQSFEYNMVWQVAIHYVYTWRRFVVVKIRVSKIPEMRFYLTFGFLRFKIVNKRNDESFQK